MTTRLPAIRKRSDGRNLHNARLSSIKNPPDVMSIEKSSELRCRLPNLKKHDIAKFRNTYSHNMCLDMLTEGYHMSFCELIRLIRQQMERREAAGPESLLWIQPVLQNEPDKLNILKTYLTKAEHASRIGASYEEYKARYELAQSFIQNNNDQWLADHFFQTCLEVAKKEGQETQILAEAYCNVGLCLQNNKKNKDAASHLDAYLSLAKEHPDWITMDGVPMYQDACTKLYTIYTILGLEMEKSGEDDDGRSSLSILQQALDMAKSSQDRKLEGEASYNLGLAYQRANQLDVAQSHLLNFYESCQGDSNSDGIGRACDAIAKIYARQGNKEKSVEFLKRFVELTEKTGLESEYCLACHNLGNVCNSVGNYDEATEYFSKAYNISRALNDPDSTNINRVQYGIAMAHRVMGQFANHIVIMDSTCMARLLDWKSVRADQFNKPIPSTAPGAAYHLLLAPPVVAAQEAKEDHDNESEKGSLSVTKEEAEASESILDEQEPQMG